jgi:hypothetical protein
MRLKMKYIHPQLGTPLMLKSISIAGNYLYSLIYVYLLNISKACLGAGGMLHFGVAD